LLDGKTGQTGDTKSPRARMSAGKDNAIFQGFDREGRSTKMGRGRRGERNLQHSGSISWHYPRWDP